MPPSISAWAYLRVLQGIGIADAAETTMLHVVLRVLHARTGQCRASHCLHAHTGTSCTISTDGPDSEFILALQKEACCRLPDSYTWHRKLPTLQASLSARGWSLAECAGSA